MSCGGATAASACGHFRQAIDCCSGPPCSSWDTKLYTRGGTSFLYRLWCTCYQHLGSFADAIPFALTESETSTGDSIVDASDGDGAAATGDGAAATSSTAGLRKSNSLTVVFSAVITVGLVGAAGRL